MNVNPPVTDLSDANAELRLVTAARLQMAKARQQLLSSVVMLGINRIVITDGSINAKVVFDMRASDKAKRNYAASMHDREAERYKESGPVPQRLGIHIQQHADVAASTPLRLPSFGEPFLIHPDRPVPEFLVILPRC
jgi:hypothetical protein